jgi:hypothetical protein
LHRVFNLKLEELLDDLIKKQVLGRPIGHMHVIEFQKRGLPHAHILLHLADEDKPLMPEDYDRIICAELPDRNSPLWEIITSSMMHGPCGPDFAGEPFKPFSNTSCIPFTTKK